MTATMRSYVSAVSQIWDTCLITLTTVSISEVISGRRLKWGDAPDRRERPPTQGASRLPTRRRRRGQGHLRRARHLQQHLLPADQGQRLPERRGTAAGGGQVRTQLPGHAGAIRPD